MAAAGKSVLHEDSNAMHGVLCALWILSTPPLALSGVDECNPQPHELCHPMDLSSHWFNPINSAIPAQSMNSAAPCSSHQLCHPCASHALCHPMRKP